MRTHTMGICKRLKDAQTRIRMKDFMPEATIALTTEPSRTNLEDLIHKANLIVLKINLMYKCVSSQRQYIISIFSELHY